MICWGVAQCDGLTIYVDGSLRTGDGRIVDLGADNLPTRKRHQIAGRSLEYRSTETDVMGHRKDHHACCRGIPEHRLLAAGGIGPHPGALIGDHHVRSLGCSGGNAVVRIEWGFHCESEHTVLVLPHGRRTASGRRASGPHQKICLSLRPLEPCERRPIGHRDLHFVGAILVGKYASPVRVLSYPYVRPRRVCWFSCADRMCAFQTNGHDCLDLRREQSAINNVVRGVERVSWLNLAVGLNRNGVLVP